MIVADGPQGRKYETDAFVQRPGYNRGMGLALMIFGVAFAAFWVLLAVRIINRRERWTKWTAAAVVLTVIVIYPLSEPWIMSYLELYEIGPTWGEGPSYLWQWQNSLNPFSAPSRYPPWLSRITMMYKPLGWLYTNCPREAAVPYAGYRYWVRGITGAIEHQHHKRDAHHMIWSGQLSVAQYPPTN